jgi:hypothetical protein
MKILISNVANESLRSGRSHFDRSPPRLKIASRRRALKRAGKFHAPALPPLYKIPNRQTHCSFSPPLPFTPSTTSLQPPTTRWAATAAGLGFLATATPMAGKRGRPPPLHPPPAAAASMRYGACKP